MAKILSKPKFKPDDAVLPVEPFTGTIDERPFVVTPTGRPLRGDDPIVLAYPERFVRFDDDAGRVAYWERVNAEQAAERRRVEAEEAKLREEKRKKVQRLADKLEAEERQRIEREKRAQADRQREDAEYRRKVAEDEERRREDDRIYSLALAEARRRIESEGDL